MWPSAKQVRRRTMPSWPMSRHDFLLYVLVALGPNSSLLHFLCHTTRKPKEGNNPLIYAAYFNKYEHALTLLSRGARLDCKGWEVVRFCQALPIEVALQSGHSDIVTLFVRAGSPIPPHLFTVVYDRYHTKISSTAMKSLLQTDSFVESAAETFLTGFVSRPLAFLDHFLKNDPVAEEDLIDCIRRMVQIGYDPFAATSCQNSLLRIIVQHGHVAVARYLLSLGMSLPDDSLVTLNLWSMRNGVRMVHFLVESGADTLARTSNGDSVLHLVLAAFDERDALETTKLLVDHHCDPSSPNSRGETPIRIAVCQGHVSVTGYLLSLGVRLPPDLLVTPGLWRMKNGTRMIRCLVGNGTNALAHINNGDSLLHAMLATFDEHDALETAQFLVAHGFDPLKFNSHGETPIHIAVERGHVSVMGYLLSVGAPLPYDALFVALHSPRLQGASLRRSKVIHLLVDQGANILARRSNGDSVLHSAITTFPIGDPGVLNFMELVVARGFDLGIANIHGVTPLHSAVRRGDVNIVKRLLSYHAPLPPDILFIAMQSDSISSLQMMGVIENLVTFGCDPLVRNKAGYTPLHVATLKGYLGVVGYLLSILDSPPAEDLVSAAMLVPPGMQGRIIRSMLESALRGLKSSKNHVL
ncbi:ankyrin repeat-containing domain protein [Boletus edulis BED1]|uniref:Ankyrin repeat-containing domain protein n=1 Tax=Boletus edulis BED1 TaxID=1328754 RepID=A0AAD4BNH0_BOLED|nr:ankyrin repeat-containing domain protein [Boletus edulis BED1]